MNSFFRYYTRSIFKPKLTFNELLTEPRQLQFAMGAVAMMAAVYTVVYVFLIFGGGQPFKPWLDIPLDVYYRYNVFFCAPSMFLGWILAAGVVHLLSTLIVHRGTFEQILTLFGFGIGLASWSTGVHDLLTSFLGAVGIISQRNYEVVLNSPTIWRAFLWAQMALYLVWFITLFYIAVRSVYGVSPIKSILLGICGFLTYQCFFLIFNR